MAAVHPDEAMRKAGDDLERKADALDAEISLRPDVFRALQDLRLDGADAETRYYVERTLRDLRRLGVDRPEATRARLKGLRDELTVLMAEYLRNIRERGRRFTVASAKELDGLPADFIARHKPDASGAITLTSDIVDARPVLTYATSEDAAQADVHRVEHRRVSGERRGADEDAGGARARWRGCSAIRTGRATTWRRGCPAT